MPSELTIRRATRKDLPELIQLYRHLVPGDEPLDDEKAGLIWDRFSRIDGGSIFLGVCDVNLVATFTLVVIPNFVRSGASDALIVNVVTHSDFRGRGYGKAVLAHAVETAWSLGCYKVMLLTGSKDPATPRVLRGCRVCAQQDGL